MALNIKGKAALVTGGGSGICLEVTRKLLSGGCNVLIADLRLLPPAQQLIDTYARLAGLGSAKAIFTKTDVTDWLQLSAAFDKAVETFGRLDIVVPGAGVYEPDWSSFWQFNTPDTQDTVERSSFKIFDVNLNHPVRATQLAVDIFMRQKRAGTSDGGVVINFASIASQLAIFPVPLYCASKAAVASFTRPLALLEPRHRIRVSAVAPGAVQTPMTKSREDWWVEGKDTWVQPGQVADAILELITKEEYVGGTVLEVGADKVRKVEVFNDPGPQGSGHSMSNAQKGLEDVWSLMDRNFGK